MRFEDGFGCIYSFALDLTIEIGEKVTQPVSTEGGGMINTTTHRNTAVRTQAPKVLKSITQGSATVAFAFADLAKIYAMVGRNQLITATYPSANTCQFWGSIDKFVEDGFKEGEQPTAKMTVEPTNRNDSGVETPPVWA